MEVEIEEVPNRTGRNKENNHSSHRQQHNSNNKEGWQPLDEEAPFSDESPNDIVYDEENQNPPEKAKQPQKAKQFSQSLAKAQEQAEYKLAKYKTRSVVGGTAMLVSSFVFIPLTISSPLFLPVTLSAATTVATSSTPVFVTGAAGLFVYSDKQNRYQRAINRVTDAFEINESKINEMGITHKDFIEENFNIEGFSREGQDLVNVAKARQELSQEIVAKAINNSTMEDKHKLADSKFLEIQATVLRTLNKFEDRNAEIGKKQIDIMVEVVEKTINNGGNTGRLNNAFKKGRIRNSDRHWSVNISKLDTELEKACFREEYKPLTNDFLSSLMATDPLEESTDIEQSLEDQIADIRPLEDDISNNDISDREALSLHSSGKKLLNIEESGYEPISRKGKQASISLYDLNNKTKNIGSFLDEKLYSRDTTRNYHHVVLAQKAVADALARTENIPEDSKIANHKLAILQAMALNKINQESDEVLQNKKEREKFLDSISDAIKDTVDGGCKKSWLSNILNGRIKSRNYHWSVSLENLDKAIEDAIKEDFGIARA